MDGHLSTSIGSSEQSKVAYLFVSGTLTSSDYTFISQMSGLKYLDLSGIANTTLPKGSVVNGAIDLKQTISGVGGVYETIIFPLTITSIPEYCFSRCSNLKGDLIIPDYITQIGDGAFFNCTGFKGSLVIGKNVTDIGKNAFSTDGADSYSKATIKFSKIYCKATTPPQMHVESHRGSGNGSTYYESSFGDYTMQSTFAKSVAVPKGCAQSYQDSDWKIFSTIEEVDFDKIGY